MKSRLKLSVVAPALALTLGAGAFALYNAPLAYAGSNCTACTSEQKSETQKLGSYDKAGDKKAEKKDIIGVATGEGMDNMTTLVAAIKAADLVEALQGEGPFTVFAPTNDAFAALPEGTVEDLLKPENKEQLQQILLYHVVEGKVKSKNVTDGSVATLQGDTLTTQVEDGKVMINDATVTTADVKASNGIIHQIDKVLIPGS
jgi:uncharacterized surface protein with fasciclin (FAS1) repeats